MWYIYSIVFFKIRGEYLIRRRLDSKTRKTFSNYLTDEEKEYCKQAEYRHETESLIIWKKEVSV